MDSSFLTFSPKALSRKKCNIVQRSTRSKIQKPKINLLQDVHCSPSNLCNIEKNQRESIGSRNKHSHTIVLNDSVEVISGSTKKIGRNVSSCIPKIDSSKNCSAKNSTMTFSRVKDNEPQNSDNDKLEEIRNWLNELHTAHERRRYTPPWSKVNTSSVPEVSLTSHTPGHCTMSSPKRRVPETREFIGSKTKHSNTIVLNDSVEVISETTKKIGKSVSSCIPKIDCSKQNYSAKNSTLTFKHVKDNESQSSDNDKFEGIKNWLNELHTVHERKRYSPPWSKVNTSSVPEVSPTSHTPEICTISSPKWRIPETSSDESMESWKQKVKPHSVSNVKIPKSAGEAPSTRRITESSDDEIVRTARRNKICVINDSASTDTRSDQSQLSTVENKNADVVSNSSSKESFKLSLRASKKSGNSKCHGTSTKSTCSNGSVSVCSADRLLSTLYGDNWDKANVLSPVVQKRKTVVKKPAPKDDPISIVSTLSEYYGSSWNKEKVLTPLVNRRKITTGKENTPPIVGKMFNDRPLETPKSKLPTIGKNSPKFCSPTRGVSKNASLQGTWSFLRSLSTCSPRRCDREALLYKKEFKKRKDELCTHLFKLFNAEVFENKLPFNLRIDWNARMIKTAGFCYYQTVLGSQEKIRTSRIELSTKVCTTADRVRDTLIHELCHAAVWIVNGYKAGHGAEWKAWTKKAKKRFPELPGIERCHSYNIEKKYIYKCKNCGYSFGRHSKSLDLQRKRCGHCYGSFELLVNIKPRNADAGVQSTPRTVRAASGFALYVKENYKATKEKNSGLKHAEIMKLLGNQFAGMKLKPNQ